MLINRIFLEILRHKLFVTSGSTYMSECHLNSESLPQHSEYCLIICTGFAPGQLAHRLSYPLALQRRCLQRPKIGVR